MSNLWKVKMPKSINELVALAKSVTERHAEEGSNSSPLQGLDDDLGTVVAQLPSIEADVAMALDHLNKSRQITQKIRKQLGTAVGMNQQTPGTVYSIIAKARRMLKVAYEGRERELTNWGLNPVRSQSKSQTEKSAKRYTSDSYNSSKSNDVEMKPDDDIGIGEEGVGR